MKRMMCLWFPNWPVQWRMITRPSDRKRPLIVHGLSERGKVRVIACSRAARQRGVSPGMLLAEAQSLWPSSANVWFEPHDPLADREKLKELAQACRLLSPEIAVDPSESPDCLLIDVTGREYCRDHEIEIAEEAIDSLAERGYWASAAVADTIGVAWAVVRSRNLSPPPPSPKRRGGRKASSSPLGFGEGVRFFGGARRGLPASSSSPRANMRKPCGDCPLRPCGCLAPLSRACAN